MYENAPNLCGKYGKTLGSHQQNADFTQVQFFGFRHENCQVRVVKVYVSCNPPPPSPSPRPPPPDLNCKQTRWIRSSGPRRTSTASSGRTVEARDQIEYLNCKLVIAVFPARPQLQRISEDIPGRMQERMSEDMPDRMPERMSEYMPEGMRYDVRIDA